MGAFMTVRCPSNGSDDSVPDSKRLDRSHNLFKCLVNEYADGVVNHGQGRGNMLVSTEMAAGSGTAGTFCFFPGRTALLLLAVSLLSEFLV